MSGTVGFVYCSHADAPFGIQYLLYFLAQTALPLVRSFHRQGPFNALRPPRESRLVSGVLLAVTLSLQRPLEGDRGIESPSRCATRCVGACDLGSLADIHPALLPLQSWPCSRLLAFPAHAAFRPQTKCHHSHDPCCSDSAVGATVSPFVILLSASQGLGLGAQGSDE